jgi:DNA-binding transcriptional LysR family regulator
MKNWDNIRFFLAIARSGSVRAASTKLNVNHSTVLRRVSQMEEQLGARLFEKLPTGYELTVAGEEILELAENMEETSSLLQTRVFARDQRLTGTLRVAMPPAIATDLLMPDLAEFSRDHPEIELEIISSYELVNLTKRQADVAIRLVYDQKTLPQHLFGTRLQDFYAGVYVSRALLRSNIDAEKPVIKWILKEEELPEWAIKHDITTNQTPFKTSDMSTQIAAVKAGIGMTVLPCFLGDADASLKRVPGSSIHHYGNLWFLSHGETRKTKRVRLFGEFIKKRMLKYIDLLNGKSSDDFLHLD